MSCWPCRRSRGGSTIPSSMSNGNFKHVEDAQKNEDRNKVTDESLRVEIEDLKRENENLKSKSSEATSKIISLQDACRELQQKINDKENDISRLQDTLRRVLPNEDLNTKRRRTNIYEPSEDANTPVKRTPKTPEQRAFFTEAIRKNDILKYLNNDQINEIIECIHRAVHKNGVFIKEGTKGDCLYILEAGELQVTQESTFLRDLHPPVVFGELAILYNCKRTATVTAKTPTKVWKLERSVFQNIMRNAAKSRSNELKKALRKVPLLKNLSETKITKLTEVLEEETFTKGEYITRQGEVGETFYIMMEGEVDVTNFDLQKRKEMFIRSIGKGSYFGEQALRNETGKRGANVLARTSMVRCLTLEKKHFLRLIGDLADNWNNISSRTNSLGLLSSNSARSSAASRPNSTVSLPARRLPSQFENLTLDDLKFEGILGFGGFGRVELRTWKERPDQSFALKCMKKAHIVETKQQEHIISEKVIMRDAECPFICQLYRTFKDDRYVYMLLEACLGGELWSKLRDDGFFSESRARFYTACVVEALDYLHPRGIVYRDLKPENLLLDAKGFLKLVDFGFATTLKHGAKTWTFCGTPEYVAPEVILNKGHDLAVDYWALGILIFEMLTGNPPFNSADAMKTYRMALRGIDAIEWPQRISKTSQNLIRRLCRENPSERIGNLNDGVRGIRNHRWFSGFDWESLRDFSYPVAYVPEISTPNDLRNFDNYENHQENVPIELSGWDENF